MSGASFWRAAAVATQVAVLIVALGCESPPPGAPTALRETSTVPLPPAPGPIGAIGGTVTINGEARPIVWVELQRGSWPWAYGTTIPRGVGSGDKCLPATMSWSSKRRRD
jgi:hypothetical protein